LEIDSFNTTLTTLCSVTLLGYVDLKSNNVVIFGYV